MRIRLTATGSRTALPTLSTTKNAEGDSRSTSPARTDDSGTRSAAERSVARRSPVSATSAGTSATTASARRKVSASSSRAASAPMQAVRAFVIPEPVSTERVSAAFLNIYDSRPVVSCVCDDSIPRNSYRAPPSPLSVIVVVQPWASAISLTIARPKPVPSAAVEYPDSKTCSRSSGGIPGPSSAT